MPPFDPARTADRLADFIHHSLADSGFTQAVIALSGGVDSATSYALAVRALGRENVHALLLPYGALSAEGLADARLMVASLGASESTIDIQPVVDSFLALDPAGRGVQTRIGSTRRNRVDPAMDSLRKGNIMARARMIVVYDQARKHNALVVGTENRSEHLLGYFTRFGDEASDIEPLRGLYKTQVYQLAKYLGVVEPILSKAPSAGLWEGQTDEGEFGFTYAEADPILALIYDQGKSLDEAAAEGHDRANVEAITDWVTSKDFKHHLPLVAD